MQNILQSVHLRVIYVPHHSQKVIFDFSNVAFPGCRCFVDLDMPGAALPPATTGGGWPMGLRLPRPENTFPFCFFPWFLSLAIVCSIADVKFGPRAFRIILLSNRVLLQSFKILSTPACIFCNCHESTLSVCMDEQGCHEQMYAAYEELITSNLLCHFVEGRYCVLNLKPCHNCSLFFCSCMCW